MSKKIGDLHARITADTKDLEKNLDKARRKTQTFADKGKEGFHKMNKAVISAKGAVGAFAAALAVKEIAQFVLQSTELAKELDSLSKVAGVSAETLQRNAVAAKTQGISMEKLADIYKDVNDKIGDFVTTGAGPFKDFMESVGYAAGLTADSFANLSGPDALGLMVKTLEEAGASQQQMTFFLESMASDTTQLLPLLKDGSKAMRELGDNAQSILSDEAVAKGAALNKIFSDAADTLKTKMVDAAITATAAILRMAGNIDVLTELPEIDEEIAEAEAAIEGYQKRIQDKLENPSKYYNSFFGADTSTEEAAVNNLIKRLDELKAKREEVFTQENPPEQTDTGDDEGSGISVTNVDRQTEIDALVERNRQRLEYGRILTEEENKLQSLKALLDETDNETERLAVLAEIAAQEQVIIDKRQEAADKQQEIADKQAERDQAELDRQQAKIDALIALGDPLSSYKDKLEEINRVVAEGNLTPEQIEALAEAYRTVAKEMQGVVTGAEDHKTLAEEIREELQSMEAQMDKIKIDGIMGMGDAFADFVIEGKASFGEFAEQMLKDIGKMIVKMLFLKAIQQSMGALGIDLGLGGTGKAGGGTIQPNRVALVGERGPELIVPSSPSRVMNNGQMKAMGGGGGVMRVEIINNGTPAEVSDANQRVDAEGTVTQIVLKDLNRGGPISSGLGSLYGVRRKA